MNHFIVPWKRTQRCKSAVLLFSCTVMSDSEWPPRLLCPWDSPGFSRILQDSPSPGVGCHFLLQGIFQTQGSNPHLLHWEILYRVYSIYKTKEKKIGLEEKHLIEDFRWDQWPSWDLYPDRPHAWTSSHSFFQLLYSIRYSFLRK